ncbi:MAG: nucleoside deaminase [Bacteroidales bacterium]|nr:nucleoside deaminase [Bacteroidales bacterium]
MTYPLFSDEYFMNEALKEAHKALELDEVPVGAVVVNQKRIIARAHNMTQQLNDVTAHAEMIAITAASNYLGAKYLSGCTLYVTLEPCIMCAAATRWAQLSRIVFAASDPKEGFSRMDGKLLHKRTEQNSGILEKEASGLLKEFFRNQRNKQN